MSTSRIAREGYILLSAKGILDGRTENSTAFSEALNASGQHPEGDFVIDLSGVEYINSSMLGELVRFLNVLQNADHRLILMAPPSSVESVLTMTGLVELMPLAADEAEARSLLGIVRRRPAAPGESVDYNRLAEEIEEIVLGNDEAHAARQRKRGELRKVLGESAAEPGS